MKNVIKTYVLLGVLTFMLLIFGSLLGGPAGVMVALVISLIFNIVTYWFSDRIVLSMYKAQEIYATHPSNLYEIVQKVAKRANVPMPRVYIIPGAALNAFATGRNPQNAAVAATEGLVNSLSQEEIEAVIAHEISHIRNRDILISSLAAVIASAIMHIVSIAKWGVMLGFGRDDDGEGGILGTILLVIFAPVAALLIQTAISRSREYEADKGSRQLVGSGVPLANALRKIEQMSSRGQVLSNANPQTAHMFISNPLGTKTVVALFSTHPPVEDRINKLLYGDR
jgi:heat shock protein HtpX